MPCFGAGEQVLEVKSARRQGAQYLKLSATRLVNYFAAENRVFVSYSPRAIVTFRISRWTRTSLPRNGSPSPLALWTRATAMLD
jgi:hypothetical protein